MKRSFVAFALPLLVGACVAGSIPVAADSPNNPGLVVAQAQQPAARPAPKQEQYKPGGIMFGEAVLSPGMALGEVFGVFGPPDAVEAKRGKSGKAEADYVNLVYYDRFVVHMNADNVIESISVDDPNLPLFGVPFKIGASKEAVLAAWGEPDRNADGFLMYWHRGIYVKISQAGVVERVSFSKPGVSEEQKAKPAPAPTMGA